MLPKPEDAVNLDTWKQNGDLIQLNLGLSDLQAICYKYSGDEEKANEILRNNVDIVNELTTRLLNNAS